MVHIGTPPPCQTWFVCPKPHPQPALRLFCFPYAGGGASVYRTWAANVPPSIEVCAIQLPGREMRFHELPSNQVEAVVDALAPCLTPFIHTPFAFFGHSLGTLIAFELAHRLQADHQRSPDYLFAAARHAPHLLSRKPVIHALPEPEFVQQLAQHYGGIPQQVLDEPELKAMYIRVLRADFTLLETYQYRAAGRLNCPIAVFGGTEDLGTHHDTLDAWRIHTSRAFSLHMIAGGHFFVQQNQPELFAKLLPILTSLLERNSR